jgi:beta-glucosidase
MNEFQLPKDFLLGSSTSALQIEGGNLNTNWSQWCDKGRIRDGSHIKRGTDHWNLYAHDIELMKKLNMQTYCMSIEWSRIEPDSGVYNLEAIEHYRDEISMLVKNGIKPLVSLHHFTNPIWMERKGGWENPEVVQQFVKYINYAVGSLADLVEDWITINDPNLMLLLGYLKGMWPPGKVDKQAFYKAMGNIATAHIQTYKAIHKIYAEKKIEKAPNVGIALHLRIFDGENGKLINKRPAKISQRVFQDVILEAMALGKFDKGMGTEKYPLGKGKYYDFLGMHYFTRNIVRFVFDKAKKYKEIIPPQKTRVSDRGVEIYPEGLYRLCKKYYAKYKAPIYITENGVSANDDNKRSKFIYEHLNEIAKLNKEGIPVNRYYHWTFIDSFECHEGESGRMGLIHNDFESQKRTIRKSGEFYSEICKNKMLTSQMINKYLLR